jgi:hypothetical protein
VSTVRLRWPADRIPPVRLGLCSFVSIAVAAACNASASAEPARVNLTYVRKGTAAASCPDEPTFRALVAARLGYDAFAPGGDLALLVELKPQGPELVGRLSLSGARGEDRGQRTMRSGDTDCLELASSLALATAFAIDPEAVRARVSRPPPAAAPAPAAPPAAAPAPLAPPPARDAPAAPERPRAALGFRLGAGFVLPVGIVPAPRGGLRGGAGLDGGNWSVGVEGAFLFSSSRAEPFGEVSTSVAYGSLVPCYHPRLHDAVMLDLCVVGSVGAMFSEASNVSRPDPVTDPFATVGPRAAVTVLPWPNLGFVAAFDVPVPLSRVRLAIDDAGQRREVWFMSPIGFIAGLSAVLRFR